MGFLSSLSDFASSAFGLAKDGFSFLGSSGLLSAGSGALNSALSYGLNKKMAKYNSELQKDQMKYQYDLNQNSLVDSPANTRRGLENAGYNPMLAVTQATNAPIVSGLGVGVPNFEYGIGDFGAAFDRASNSASQRKLQEKEREKIDKLTDAELEKLQSESKAALVHSGAAMYDAATKRMEATARIEKIKKETDSIGPEGRRAHDYITPIKEVVSPIVQGAVTAYGAKKGIEVATSIMKSAGIRNARTVASQAVPQAVANSAKGSVLIGSRFVPGAALAVGAGWLGKKAQDSARKNNSSSWRSYRSHTHHLSAGW